MTAAVLAEDREESTWRTMRRGLALSPEMRTGLAGTIGLALVAMAGRAARRYLNRSSGRSTR